MYTPIKTTDFSALRLKLASPQVIHDWSFGEILKPETINYRTQRPEKDGLFCEKIFGPSKDWECYCGKYKKIRYKGIVCDKCGVEVTRSAVRRERMGHIDLAVPVTHIWYLRNVPSRIGLILDISVLNLEKVVYFASFMITSVNEEQKREIIEQIKSEYKGKKKAITAEYGQKIKQIEEQEKEEKLTVKQVEEAMSEALKIQNQKLEELDQILGQAEEEIKEIKKLKIISESEYHDLSLKYGHIFEASIGAEAIRKVLAETDLETLIDDLEAKLKKSKGVKKDKLMRRVRLLSHLKKNGIRPEWMILTVLPVIPPDLRPMVALDGGRFATSDLNDLYRRVINRNNRLKQLLDLKAPEVIVRNEKRMLQEAVDALVDNGARHSKTVTASTGQKRMLKSLADMLKGKQGRFRQNLLGKRTDYSGRSVIVVGPHLKISQCGLPKKMALELFKPFIIGRLIKEGYVHNVRSGSRYIESDRFEVWDILEEIIKKAYVLLNRAPTLHRLGIQAFRPVLIEGKAIQVHPLVCAAFNADFDGDQMAVHVPLTEEARTEAANIMLSSNNLLSPARGEPIATPSKDMVWGCYYMTSIPQKWANEKPVRLGSFEEAVVRYNLGDLHIRQMISVPHPKTGELLDTTVGRILFNKITPEKIDFVNETMDARSLRKLVGRSFEIYGLTETGQFLDRIKDLGYQYATLSGWSWGMDDIPTLEEKPSILEQSDILVDECQEQYEMGLLTQKERYSRIIEIWTKAKDKIVELSQKAMDPDGPVSTMVNSGARGSASQLIQIVGMKGLVANPAGDIIELPVKASFKGGLDVLEYFISTHGARKGLADTALRTASSGYLTRRMVDVAQEVVIKEEDCATEQYQEINRQDSEEMGKTLVERILGRYVAEDVKNPKTKRVILRKGELINDKVASKLKKLDLESVKVRSVLFCETKGGLCQKCYGWDLSRNDVVDLGSAVGVIAAQSIGEPGTQLTMRTFHTGGVAGSDITQGLPRVDELFEVRPPKHKAVICEVEGKVKIDEVIIESASEDNSLGAGLKQKVVKVEYRETQEDKYIFATARSKKKKEAVRIKVKDGDHVEKGNLLYLDHEGNEVVAERGGVVRLESYYVVVVVDAEKVKEYPIPVGYKIWVKEGELVAKGTPLTEGSLDLVQYFKLKGLDAVQKYIIKEIQHIYSSQGQELNDKHIEIIVKQMLSRIYVKDSGDTSLLPGDVVELGEFVRQNSLLKGKQKAATGERLILGISKVALTTSSFLSAASFQETARVLIEASLTGRVDRLEGLKENVIIGRLIPVGTGFKAEKK